MLAASGRRSDSAARRQYKEKPGGAGSTAALFCSARALDGEGNAGTCRSHASL